MVAVPPPHQQQHTLSQPRDWLRKLNASFKDRCRKIVMFCDNASCHAYRPKRGESCTTSTLMSFDTYDLSNIKVVFLPPNID